MKNRESCLDYIFPHRKGTPNELNAPPVDQSHGIRHQLTGIVDGGREEMGNYPINAIKRLRTNVLFAAPLLLKSRTR